MGLVGGVRAAATVIPLSIDGNAVHGNNASGDVIVSISTTKTNNLMIAVITTNAGPILSVVGGGLTWNFLGRSNAGANDIEMWWAFAPTLLSSASITSHATTANFMTVDLFAVTGAKTSGNPFDASVTSINGTISISTTAANTMIVGGFRVNIAAPTAGPGFSQLPGQAAGADFQIAETKIVTTPQTNLPVTFSGGGISNGSVAAAILQGP